MAVDIKTIVDAFATRVDFQDYNLAADINNLQTALDALAYASVNQANFANTETLSAAKTLTDDDPALQFLNPNTADRDVNLPALADTNHIFAIMNTNGSTYLLTVKNAGGTTIRVVPSGKMYFFVSDGNQWVSVGFDLYKTISPAQITSNQNNYNPTGNYEADILRLDLDAARTITGLAGGSAGRIKIVENISSYTLTLSNENASSDAGNRFAFGLDLELPSKSAGMLIYDPTSARWRFLGVVPTVTASNTATLTNKDLKSATNTIENASTATSAASHTPTGNYLRNRIKITAQAEAVTINEPSGTPTDGNMLIVQIKDNGTARAITWNAAFVGDLPTTTTLGKWTYVIGMYNSTAAKWHMTGKWTEV